MSSLVRFLLRVFFGAEAVASAYGLVERLLAGEAAMIGSITISSHFLEVTYVFLIAAGVFATVGLSVGWILRWDVVSRLCRSRTAEFQALYEEIAERRNELISVIDGQAERRDGIACIARLAELRAALVRLKISTPQSVPSIHNIIEDRTAVSEWAKFLIKLAPQARLRDLKAARNAHA